MVGQFVKCGSSGVMFITEQTGNSYRGYFYYSNQFKDPSSICIVTDNPEYFEVISEEEFWLYIDGEWNTQRQKFKEDIEHAKNKSC